MGVHLLPAGVGHHGAAGVGAAGSNKEDEMTRLIEIEAPQGYWWKGSKLQKDPLPPYSSHKVFRTLKKAKSKIDGIFKILPDVGSITLLEWRIKNGVRQVKEIECTRRMK